MVRVLLLHPDLGTGGPERLVVDAALALKSKNHTVRILTTHHDPDNCFEETKDGTLQVTTIGDWLPRTLNGRCYELCAVIRMIYLAIYVSLSFCKEFHPDVIFCNKFSGCIPFLRISGDPTIIFYCYFPDRLSTQEYSLARALYREPLDWLKQKTAGLADIVLVNSKFSAGEFQDTFTKVSTVPQVLHPSINIANFEKEVPGSENKSDDIVFLAFSQFERVKNLQLAIEAFYSLKSNFKLPDGKNVKLILAGAYMAKDPESVQYFRELTKLIDKLGFQSDEITLLKSPSDKDKLRLFKTSQALVYTPREDHFGIVPLEAMYCQLPVIAVNDGGSVESIVDNETGFLCEDTPNDFAEAMFKIIEGGVELKQSFGDKGRRRVVKNYSFKVFAERLHNLVRKQES